MDLNQVKLTPDLLCNLYGQVLVMEKGKAPDRLPAQNEPASANEKIRSLGGHQKSILIIVNNLNIPFLMDEELAYLTRILNACKLTLEDVAVVNLANSRNLDYEQLQKSYPSEKVICFGVSPEMLQLPVDFPPYQLQRSGISIYLHAPSLSNLEPMENERRKLWTSLQKLFNLKP